jgi:hypothetical protein
MGTDKPFHDGHSQCLVMQNSTRERLRVIACTVTGIVERLAAHGPEDWQRVRDRCAEIDSATDLRNCNPDYLIDAFRISIPVSWEEGSQYIHNTAYHARKRVETIGAVTNGYGLLLLGWLSLYATVPERQILARVMPSNDQGGRMFPYPFIYSAARDFIFTLEA